MALTDIQVKTAKPQEKDYKLSDGDGMYLLVASTGGKRWRLKYRFGGKEKLLALGTSGHSPEKHSQKGLSLPLLKGDLKMVLSGAALPKITITFKEFALTRRNRPFSRAEARREAIITPLVAATQEKTREVVIEKVRAGVYSVTVEPVDGSSEFACLLKLHEDSSRSTVRDCGRHTLAQKKVLVKILMPEGILWDDNKSFTGSMEDSDSVTKFNAESGLTWKEYSD